ncbi:MAG: HD domain-containing protein [Planctomycetes bacterium]|nr:HD domain-containing protein [Planctomycetota bacterium]
MSANLARFLHELGVLKRVRRSGWWLAGVRDPESVAEHSFRAAAVAYALACVEGADPARAAALALFHDAAESRVGDLHRLARKYVESSGADERATRDQARRLPRKLRASLEALNAERRRGASLEARVARDADRIECLLQAREYAAQGHRVGEWVRSSVRELTTPAAKRLARAILRTDPGSWRRTSR